MERLIHLSVGSWAVAFPERGSDLGHCTGEKVEMAEAEVAEAEHPDRTREREQRGVRGCALP